MKKAQKTAAGRSGSAVADQVNVQDDWKEPTEGDWQNKDIFKKYKSFRLPTIPEPFRLDEYVWLEPPEDARDDWLGKIIEIRARDERNVFVVIRWMYISREQLLEVGAKNIPQIIPDNEAFLSPFEQRLPVSCVDGRANVIELDENDPFQAEPTESQMYCRSEIVEVTPNPPEESPGKKRKRQVRRGKPAPSHVIQPLKPTSCPCRKPYDPLPFGKAPMVFCPSKSCLKWYHTACVSPRSAPSDLSTAGSNLFDHALSLLAPSDDSLPSNHTTEAKPDPSASPSRRRSRASQLKPSVDLLDAAKGSIVRGTSASGIVGNVRKALTARAILDLSQREDQEERVKELMERWHAAFAAEDNVALQVDEEKPKSSETGWTCPHCASEI